MKSTEHQIQCAVVQWARAMSARYPELALLYAIPNGGARDAVTGKRLKDEGVLAGMPDLCLPTPQAHIKNIVQSIESVWEHNPTIQIGIGALYIELKTPKGRVSEAQARVISDLTRYGNKVVVCRSATEAIDAIREYLGIR